MALNCVVIPMTTFKSLNWIEKHSFLERDGKHLFMVEFIPKNQMLSAIIMCSPFAEEKVRTQRIYVSFARMAASLGVVVILFDYFGDGDSEGFFEEATFEDRLCDVEAIYEYLSSNFCTTKIALLGLRWGGTIAALSAEKLSPSALILWQPVVNTMKYFFDHLRANIASQLLIDGKISKTREDIVNDLRAGKMVLVEGYFLTNSFYTSASEMGLINRRLGYEGKSLIVQVSNSTERIQPELDMLKNKLTNSRIISVPKEFEWEKTEIWQPCPPILFEVTKEFLNAHGFC